MKTTSGRRLFLTAVYCGGGVGWLAPCCGCVGHAKIRILPSHPGGLGHLSVMARANQQWGLPTMVAALCRLISFGIPCVSWGNQPPHRGGGEGWVLGLSHYPGSSGAGEAVGGARDSRDRGSSRIGRGPGVQFYSISVASFTWTASPPPPQNTNYLGRKGHMPSS